MGILDRLRRVPPRPDARAADLSSFLGPASPYATYGLISGGGDLTWSATGRAVSPESAINSLVIVYRCVSLLAGTVGSLEFDLYRDGANGPEEIETDTALQHMRGRGYPGSLAKLVGEIPNPEMSAQQLWETMVAQGALWGCGYAQVVRGADARPKELWPLRPDRIQKKRDTQGDPYYLYTLPDGKQRVLLPEEIMRVPWMALDGSTGLSPIAVARNAVGIAQSSEQFAGKWYANAAMPSSVVTIPKAPGGPEKFKERASITREHVQALYGGMDNAARVAVIEEGSTWQALSMPLEDMQFLQTRAFQVTEIARLYGIPPHMVGDVEKSTSWGTGIEQQSLGFLTYTLRPIIKRVEEAVNLNLGLQPGVRTLHDEGLSVRFDTTDLLRTDSEARWRNYAIAIQNLVLSPADVAELENIPYNAERPTQYENPHVKADPSQSALQEDPNMGPTDPMPMMDPTQQQQNFEQLLLAFREQPPPHFEFTAPPVTVFNKDVSEDIRSTVESLAPPTVNVDLAPIAKMQGEIEARRILDAEKAEELAAERHQQILDAITPKPMVRDVVRDKGQNIIRIVDRPMDDDEDTREVEKG